LIEYEKELGKIHKTNKRKADQTKFPSNMKQALGISL